MPGSCYELGNLPGEDHSIHRCQYTSLAFSRELRLTGLITRWAPADSLVRTAPRR
jgi:hypothetical protein